MMGAQFPDLRALWNELPRTITRPRLWTLHTLAELLFLAALVFFAVEFGGGS